MTSFSDYAAGIYKVSGGKFDEDTLALHYAVASGKPISAISLDTDYGSGRLLVYFGDACLHVWDNAQSCCESRYMSTDDDLQSFVGEKLVKFEVVDMPNVVSDDEFDTDLHEQTFVKLETTGGTITLVTHNEHNGYYGGIDIMSDWKEQTHGTDT